LGVCVPCLITLDENVSILRVLSHNEMRDDFNIDPFSTLGLDDFTGRFYGHCLDIVGHDVFAVQKFFRAGRVFPALNSNFIVFVPKTLTALQLDCSR